MNDRNNSGSNYTPLLMLIAILLLVGGGWATFRIIRVRQMEEQVRLEAEHAKYLEEKTLEAERTARDFETKQKSGESHSAKEMISPTE